MQQGLAWAIHPHRFNPDQVATLLTEAPPHRSPTNDAAAFQGIELGADLVAATC